MEVLHNAVHYQNVNLMKPLSAISNNTPDLGIPESL